MGFLGGGLNGVVVGVQSVNCVNWKLNVDIVAAVLFTLPTKSGQNQKASIASSIKFNGTSLNFYLPSWCNSKPRTHKTKTHESTTKAGRTVHIKEGCKSGCFSM